MKLQPSRELHVRSGCTVLCSQMPVQMVFAAGYLPDMARVALVKCCSWICFTQNVTATGSVEEISAAGAARTGMVRRRPDSPTDGGIIIERNPHVSSTTTPASIEMRTFSAYRNPDAYDILRWTYSITDSLVVMRTTTSEF